MKQVILKAMEMLGIKNRSIKLYHLLQGQKTTNLETSVKKGSEDNSERTVIDKIKRLCPQISHDTLSILLDIYTLDSLYGTERKEPINIRKSTRITIEQGSTIHRIVNSAGIKRTLEIGFAYGFSSIWILDALLNKENANHTAIDPFEKLHWDGVGIKQVEKMNNAKIFKWISDYSIHSLSTLISKKERFDFIFIDGNHRFDDVIVDFYLCDQLVEPNGIIAIDDMWMPSIRKATQFILSNRSYEIIQQEVSNMLVLKKIENDNRIWSHFNDF